jgi:pimeloyl-ACP methyl ester carboxylesterase
MVVLRHTSSIEPNWTETVAFQDLAKDHHVIAFDLRGHGKSRGVGLAPA